MDLAYDVRGTADSPLILLIHGGAEDADMLTPQQAALAQRGWQAVAYDRRGTGASTRAHWPGGDWPGSGVDQHADDAADLLRALGATPAAPAIAIGFSSGGVVALVLATRHPELVSRVIAWEPAALGVLPGGDELHASMIAPADQYLAEHPGDWVGAFHVTLTTISGGQADLGSLAVKRMSVNAEAVVRDDGRLLTRRGFAAGELPADTVTVAYGAGVNPIHRQIVDRLGAVVGVPTVEVPDADDHEIYLVRPQVLAAFLDDYLPNRPDPR